jgi:hypothetical protein
LYPAVQRAIEMRLEKETIKLPLQTVAMKTMTIGTGQVVAEFDNLYLSQVPERVIFMFVPDVAIVGHYQRNPFYFHHFKLLHAALHINCDTLPRKGLQPKFISKNYCEAYLEFLRAFGTIFSNDAPELSYEEYANGYFILAFDLTPNNTAGVGTIAHPGGGNLRLELRFSEAIPETVKVICLAEQRSTLEIDRYRNCLVTIV